MTSKTKSANVKVPVVPLFVARWYEDNKDDIDFAIWEACRDCDDNSVGKWIEGTAGAIPALVKMGIVGYEIEEAGYVVKDSGVRYVSLSKFVISEGVTTKFDYTFTQDLQEADVFTDEDMAKFVANNLPIEAEVLTLKELKENNYYEV
ncbi:hypothetical protein EH802P2_00082 [Enterococcus phage EH802P2]|nr:hypothetical protein EH802P1_00017 [Enterococcus phage EH802P1]WAX16187.1 hypothetical protein EH802P2_00082 [Enterococcus phage EH802P2]